MFALYLQSFEHCQPLGQRVLQVLSALPTEIQQDFVTDTCFTVLLDNYVPGRAHQYSWPLREHLASAVGALF